ASLALVPAQSAACRVDGPGGASPGGDPDRLARAVDLALGEPGEGRAGERGKNRTAVGRRPGAGRSAAPDQPGGSALQGPDLARPGPRVAPFPEGRPRAHPGPAERIHRLPVPGRPRPCWGVGRLPDGFGESSLLTLSGLRFSVTILILTV